MCVCPDCAITSSSRGRLCFAGDLQLQPTLPVTFETVADNDAKPLHKPRVVWTDVLHQRFIQAIETAGSEEAAVPTVILRVRASSMLSCLKILHRAAQHV
jgi:SHAQKYF class myb-like DNA-binding protein